MKVANAIAEVLKREGVEFIIGYPVNPIIEAAAEADIRTIIVRQERTGLHMADAVSRLTSGERLGVFVMQHGPGSENAFGGVAQAYSESVPIQFVAQLQARHQVVRAAHHGEGGAGGHEARLRPATKRPSGPGSGRDPVRRL